MLSPTDTLKRYLISIALLLFVDMFWLSTVGQMAVAMTEKIQGSPVVFRYGAVAVVYLAMAYLLSQATSAGNAFMIGATTYAVYDFTSYALLKNYDWRIAVADTLWGGVLFMLVHLALKGMGL
jgi:uncharacterized membrane protein